MEKRVYTSPLSTFLNKINVLRYANCGTRTETLQLPIGFHPGKFPFVSYGKCLSQVLWERQMGADCPVCIPGSLEVGIGYFSLETEAAESVSTM